MPPIKIRYADLQDANLIKNISWQTFFDTFYLHNTKENMEMFLSKNFSEEAVKKELKHAKNTFIIAYIKKQVLGYAKLSELNEPRELSTTKHIEVSRLYASKEKIGSGVGKALMNECLELAKQRIKEVIWLGVWEHNQRAIQCYRRWGFEKFGEQTFVLGKDRQNDWLMKKNLEYS
jgi:ribosomal protein S18 acetylase RimI-like enzyme